MIDTRDSYYKHKAEWLGMHLSWMIYLFLEWCCSVNFENAVRACNTLCILLLLMLSARFNYLLYWNMFQMIPYEKLSNKVSFFFNCLYLHVFKVDFVFHYSWTWIKIGWPYSISFSFFFLEHVWQMSRFKQSESVNNILSLVLWENRNGLLSNLLKLKFQVAETLSCFIKTILIR